MVENLFYVILVFVVFSFLVFMSGFFRVFVVINDLFFIWFFSWLVCGFCVELLLVKIFKRYNN